MQRAIALLSIAAVLLFAGAAFSADLTVEPATYGGSVNVNLTNGNES